MYKLRPTTKFKSDLKRIKKRGYDLSLLSSTIDQLVKGIILPFKYKDHPLSGEYIDQRECHIDPDWLLIYEKDDQEMVLYLIRTGTHSDLF